MNLRPLYAVVILCSIAELGACKSLLKKKDPDPAPSAAPVVAPPTVVAPVIPDPVASAVPAVAAPAAVDEKAIPTPQDFEDEAFEKVTAANFKAQFTTLSTAIAKK
ncbi:MAG: hypothetical protein ABUL62_30195 [Myxococcales bacterium]